MADHSNAQRATATLAPDMLPVDIRESGRGLLWNREFRGGKATKVPYQAHRPALKAAVDDPSTWAPFQIALSAYEDGKADGVGVVLGDGLVGVDLDDCRDPSTGDISAPAQSIIDALDSYTEVSPSGTGVHVLMRGTLPAGRRRKGKIEMYGSGRYFTVTGQHVAGTPSAIEDRTEALRRVHESVLGDTPASTTRSTPSVVPVDVPLDDAALLDRAFAASNGPAFANLWSGDTAKYGGDDSAADLALCNMLAFWTGADRGRMDRLFRQSRLFRPKWDERRGKDTYGDITIGRAIDNCRETYTGTRRTKPVASHGPANVQPEDSAPVSSGALILDPADPLPTARIFVERAYRVDGVTALRHLSGVFYAHDSSVNAYRECDEATIRSELYQFLETAQRLNDSKPNQPPTLTPYKPTKGRVENVMDALRAVANMPATHRVPCWLDDDPGFDPFDVLACKNGLLHIPTREIVPGSPHFFTLNGLEFAFAPSAPAPERWIRFLNTIWPNDLESQESLQEWMGYLLTPRTQLQKIMMIVGPPRSGKGTIGRVVRQLLGDRNVCGPTLASLGEQFGLQGLIGKSAAIIADARISGRSDTSVVAERLLAISGEDSLSIPRKYLQDWTGKLNVRFMFLTNELPRIEDASGAVASRHIVLMLNESFVGREDPTLFDSLLPELPGILNWALAGWDRLYERRRFLQPQSAADLIQEFQDLGSPIGAFLRERCDVGRGYEVVKSRLFETWIQWCRDNGRDHSGTVQTFGRNLRAAVPWLGETRPRADEGERQRYYQGIRLRSCA